MGTVAKVALLACPTATKINGFCFFDFNKRRLEIRAAMAAVAKRLLLASSASAVEIFLAGLDFNRHRGILCGHGLIHKNDRP